MQKQKILKIRNVVMSCFSFVFKITDYLMKLRRLDVDDEDSLQVRNYYSYYSLKIVSILGRFVNQSNHFLLLTLILQHR